MNRASLAPLPARDRFLLGRHPQIAALALGVLSATGFAPLGLWPLALCAMGGFAALVAQSPDARRAAWLGWLFGWAHFTLGNNWIAAAFTYQAAMPAALGWLAVPLLSIYLAVYPAIAALGARALAGRGLSWAFAFALAGCWTISELLRARVFTGYAWNPFAMVLLGPFDRPGLAALAPWLGTYALSGAAVLLAAAAALLAARARWMALAGLAVLVGAGMFVPAPVPRDSALAVTIVQGDLTQARLENPVLWDANFARLSNLSQRFAPGGPRVVMWSESGLVDYLRPGYPQRFYDQQTAFANPELARRRLGRVIGPGSLLMTGAVDLELRAGRLIGAYNAVTAVAEDGSIRGGYAKSHLVPYGEYLPLRPLLEPLGLSRLVPGSIDFLPGPGPKTLDLGRFGRAAVQVCYEIVFSGEVVERGTRPDYIFNDSNDGWFGTFGPPQHLAQARMRALEEGLPVLRATTTGISAVIDAHGVVRRFLPQHAIGRIDAPVPRALAPTPFAILGNALALAWAMVFLGMAAVALRRPRG
ncbi:MAG: apolipoprotein N-acyltransferase [Croceibacterium sp.]